MLCAPRGLSLHSLLSVIVSALGLIGCSSSTAPSPTTRQVAEAAPTKPVFHTPVIHTAPGPNVMLGIDILEADGFAPLRGKRIGLLTHPAGVDRRGVSTIEILLRAPGVNLVALFSAEHGIYGDRPASENYGDKLDPRTGLMVFSLYTGRGNSPTKAQLKGIDALVIDLQDIGTRSYTFISAMKLAMEGCFLNNVEVIVLDRPNPLGGLKVDGPLLDAQWISYAGEFRVPYVHGLTIGELATMAKEAPGVLAIPEAVRARGRLTVVAMRGWRRSMRWPDTGLTWVPTSPMIADYQAVVGYPMSGLGCYLTGFQHGIGNQYAFRGISHKTAKLETIERLLREQPIAGIDYRKVSAPNAKTGQPGVGLYTEVTDWDAWHPTELSFYLMKLACELEPKNPFASAPRAMANGFLRHMGSTAFFNDIAAHGAKVDLAAYLREWREKDRVYQEQSKRYWLYHN